MDKNEKKGKRKILLAKCVMWLLVVYLVVIIAAYGYWCQRCEKYEAPVREVEQRRDRLFYVRSEGCFYIDTQSVNNMLQKRLEKEKVSGVNLTAKEGILIADGHLDFKPILEILGFALNNGVTKATFESGFFPPHYKTLAVSLVIKDNTDIIVEGLKGVVVEISEDSTTIDKKVFSGDDLWHLDKTSNDIREFLKSRDYKIVVLRIHDSFNLWSFSPMVGILNELGIEACLEVSE